MGGFFSNVGKFLFGSPEKHKRVSTLRPDQEALYQQLQASLMNQGAGGAFGSAADYYRDLLSDDSQTAQSMFAPEQRNFNENIIPGLSEQFAGMGAGGLSSSGFRNAAVGAGTDLAERLGAIRAQLRQQGAAGLSSLGGMGLGNFSQDVVSKPGTTGFLSQVAPAVGNVASAAFGGPLGNMAQNLFAPKAIPGRNALGGPNVGKKTGPYGNAPSLSPQQGFQLPNFQNRAF